LVAYPQFYDSTDTTLQTAAIAVSQDSGTTYGPQTFHLWNDKGGALGATTLKKCRIRPVVFNGVSRVASGFPILDESWVQISITGKNNTGDSTMADQTTGYVPIGANNPLILQDIPKNCARFLGVKIAVPSGAQNLSQELYLELIYDEATLVLPLDVGKLVGWGIAVDWFDPSIRRLRQGLTLSAAGTDVVTVARGGFVYDGIPKWTSRVLVTLNQTANDGALTAGQSYIARLSLPSSGFAVTTTKSNRGASPVAPSVPANEINLGLVTVVYQAGGTSIINSGNLDVSSVLYGEYLVYAGTGLTAKIGAGLAFAATDKQPFIGSVSTVSLADNSLNTVYLNDDGSFGVTTSYVASISTFPLADVVTSGGAVTTISDRRAFVGRAITEYAMVIPYLGSLAVTVSDAAWRVLPFKAYLESVDIVMGSVGAGASSGNFVFQVKWRPDGTPMTSAGTNTFDNATPEDIRPVIPYDATFSATTKGNRDLATLVFDPLTKFSIALEGIPTGTFTTDPQDMIFVLHFRKAP